MATKLPPANQLIDPEWYPEGWDEARCEHFSLKLYHGGEAEMTDEEKIIAEFVYQIRKLRPSLHNLLRVARNRKELIEELTGESYQGLAKTRENHVSKNQKEG
jgi:hypothetical protein